MKKQPISKIEEINNFFGDMDLFLIDQVLKGRLNNSMNVLDVGFGLGRNLVHFIQEGYDVYGIDKDKSAVDFFKASLSQNQILKLKKNFKVGHADNLNYPQETFSLVICSRVLHLLGSREEFTKSICELCRVLKKKGIFYLTFNILSDSDEPSKLYFVPDESDVKFIEHLQFSKLEPKKTVLFDDEVTEVTMVLQKN